jgi:hypothetical protein
MPKVKISEYSTTNSANTDIESINIDEGCAPSGINNAIRELMVHLKEFQTGSSGDPLTVAGGMFISGGGSANTMTVTGILTASGGTILSSTNTLSGSNIISGNINSSGTNTFSGSNVMSFGAGTSASPSIYFASDTNTGIFSPAADTIAFSEGGAEVARFDSSGNFNGASTTGMFRLANSARSALLPTYSFVNSADVGMYNPADSTLGFVTGQVERARITSGGAFLVGKTTIDSANNGCLLLAAGEAVFAASGVEPLTLNRNTNDGTLVSLRQGDVQEGTISVSGNTVSYNAFCGGHWTQLKEGRGYNPDIPRGTVMSSIGEMSVWKSVIWTETTEHPAVPAVDAVEEILDEEGNVVEPAIEAVEGKDAWTESSTHREFYLGNLDIGATFEEDGFTKTVVDDGNERLPKVKISNVVGDKAVYGVFQTWDEAQDMLITSLGAFVVRIAAGVTVQIGDLLESNGDGCAKVQDDDVIRSKTIGKVTSTVATATYDDGSYTVPCVIYCG